LIVPCDERTVACLHALLREKVSGQLTQAERDLILMSLGAPDQLDAMLLKTRTIELARKVGVLAPAGGAVDGVEAALLMARKIGYPVYVKQSFSWAGQGVKLCRDEIALREALDSARPKLTRGLRALLKRFLRRDWYPANPPVDVQKAIDGQSAFFCVAALGGRMLAGFAGRRVLTSKVAGPSTIVRLSANPAMEASAARMIHAMGASGLLTFDFMLEAETGQAYLLECNPRPAQVGHLGGRIGIDLCAALAAGLGGKAWTPPEVVGDATIALFPQEWLRAKETAAQYGTALDVPWDDKALMKHMMAIA
jgi:biotin carboxylase